MPLDEALAETQGPPARLEWTSALAEQFWLAAYRCDLPPARAARRAARHVAAILALRVPPGAMVLTLGDRDSEYAAALLLAGFRVGRLDVGPLLRGTAEGLAVHPAWCGNLDAGDGSADLVLIPDMLVQALADEIVPLFAAVRAALRPGGRVAVTAPNGEVLDDGLAICPLTGALFHKDQHVRAFSAGALRALLERQGFHVSAMLEGQPNETGFQALDLDDWWALAAENRLRFGSSGTLLAIAEAREGVRSGDAEAGSGWLAARRAVAGSMREPELSRWVWDHAGIARFWSWLAASPLNALSFGLVSGPALLAALEPFLVPDGRHLDIGAGEGEMARVLADAGYPVAALEPSPGRRRLLAEKLRGSPAYLGGFEGIEGDLTGSFDVVMAMEVVEHVLDADLPEFFGAFERALAPGGRLLISTPNREDLAELTMVSPAEGVLFHRWQHVRAFDRHTLAALLEQHGFAVEIVHEVDAGALASGASPYARLALVGPEPAILGAGSTLVAIAHRQGEHPPPPRDPLSLDARIAAPAGRASVAAMAASLTGNGVLRRGLGPIVRRLLPLARILRPHAKRLLPAGARQALGRLGRGRANARAASVEAAFSARPLPLNALPPLLDPVAFEGGPIVMVNVGLASGGAERQIVTTLRGLAERIDRPLGLLCLRLGEADEYDFFRPALGDFAGIVRETIGSTAAQRVLRRESAAGVARMRAAIGWLPAEIQEEIERLAADFLELRPSVVHGWQDSTSITAAYAAHIAGVPRIVVSGRNMAPPHFAYCRPYMAPAYREIAGIADIAMANNSIAGAADYTQWLGLPGGRIRVLRNGIDQEGFVRPTAAERYRVRQELGIPVEAQVVGSIFRFNAEKRPLLWIEAASLVAASQPDCHFVIVGSGPLQGAALAAARRAGLADRLHLPGASVDAASYLSLFDVFLLTSQFEGTPNVVLEATLAGVPVVATPAGGTAETVEEGVTGLLVPGDGAAAIAAAVLEVLGDPAWRQKGRQAGHDFVRREFGLDRMLRETVALYRV